MSLDFVPPGPGCWTLDRSHYPGGATPISQWLVSESMEAGMRRVFAEVGVPADSMRARFVNGFMYTRLLPLIGPDRAAQRLPPPAVLKAVVRLHPRFRRRARRAARTLAATPSKAVVERWRSELRPRLVATNRRFGAVDLSGLDDRALQQHVDALLVHLRAQFELHFWLHGHDLGPVSRYLHAAIGWGLEPARAIEALGGASPSTSRPMAVLSELRRLVDESGTEVRSLEEVRAISVQADEALSEYLNEWGSVLATGYDITSFTLGELPGVVLDSILTATLRTPSDHSAVITALRERVPAAERDAFDRYLDDARAVMDLRDDNGPMTAEWPAGLLRLALLEAGHRLVARGELHEPEHGLELTPREARSLFGPHPLPGAQVIAWRAHQRIGAAELDAPETLGEPEAEPPLSALPGPLALVIEMVQVAVGHLGMAVPSSGAVPHADGLVGVGVGRSAYVGRARTASSADDAIEKLEPGDVLIVRATSPAFNTVLAVAGAVVTTHGGALSHAAVLARELGIPAIIGASGALSIPDGAMVEVDPQRGTVTVVATAEPLRP